MSTMCRVLALALLAAGCKSGSGSAGEGPGATEPGGQSQQLFELNPVREVDLLFVVSNTPGMAAKQKELARSLPLLFQELGQGESGLPDLHVGVVSSDVGPGAMPLMSGRCMRPDGDRGILQRNPQCGLQGTDLFLTSLDKGTRNNFQGDLAEVVGCMVQLGEKGCEFPQPLMAAQLAFLETTLTPQNNGFLRSNAFLMIVFLADQDDCSIGIGGTLFANDSLYPMTERTLRCSIEGHLCDGQRPPLAPFSAPLANCTAPRGGKIGGPGPLRGVDQTVEAIKTFKPRPEYQILMAAITGWPDDPSMVNYAYGPGSDGKIAELPLCATVNGTARPGLRLKAFAEQFAKNGQVFDICNSDLSAPAQALGSSMHDRLTGLCLARPPLDNDPARHCQVVLREPAATDTGYSNVPIPACREGGPRPCAQFAARPSCSDSGFGVTIDGGGAAPPGTAVSVRCSVVAEHDADAGAPQCGGGNCSSQKTLGARCDVGATAGPSQTLYRSDSSECATGLCLRPAVDFTIGRAVDTEATCTRGCSSDADCGGAALRDRSKPTDKGCVSGYRCAVPLEVGPLCCRKLCVCKDFLPAGEQPTPASCTSAGSVCENRP